jgi:mono/diheme cytochrome c family protein
MRRAWIMAACGLIAAATTALAASAPPRPDIDLDQGWDARSINDWATANQGSRLLPLAWFKGLEQPDGPGLFLDPAYMATFRYLPGPDGLPLGFTVDGQNDSLFVDTQRRWEPQQGAHTPWVGMTCAACHTNDIRYGPHTMRVYGGATLADFQAFLAAFNNALRITNADDAKFARFAARVLGPNPGEEASARLRAELRKTVVYQAGLARMNATNAVYGYGRLDAIGHIDNKIAYIVAPAAKGNPPDAPVSYPFLWNVPQHSRVEWNGSVKAIRFSTLRPMDFGAVGRNVGEVIGVFGEVVAPHDSRSKQFVSTVHVQNLVALEQQLGALRPPRWPRELLPVDPVLAGEGKVLFQQQCQSCHVDLARDDLKTRTGPDKGPLERMSVLAPAGGSPAIGTDPWMACNAALARVGTGMLAGRPISGKGPRFDAEAPVSDVLTHVVKGVMRTDTPALAAATARSALGLPIHPRAYASGGGARAGDGQAVDPFAERRARCEAAMRGGKLATLAYKARPLTGVWATGPFLHNGSVPTLYDLLLPPEQRPKSFYLGSRELDPVRVGFVTAPSAENDFVFRVVGDNGRPIEGNSNGGHDYDNASLTERQRMALVAYLKIIGERENVPGAAVRRAGLS